MKKPKTTRKSLKLLGNAQNYQKIFLTTVKHQKLLEKAIIIFLNLLNSQFYLKFTFLLIFLEFLFNFSNLFLITLQFIKKKSFRNEKTKKMTNFAHFFSF